MLHFYYIHKEETIMKTLAALALAVLLPLSFASDADATRPIPGHKYKDECKNIPGKQPIYELYGTGPYRFDTSTARPDDCYEWRKR